MALILGLLAIAALCVYLEARKERYGKSETTYVTVEEYGDWNWPPRYQDTAHVSHAGKDRVGL
jgi:hypothetical protein